MSKIRQKSWFSKNGSTLRAIMPSKVGTERFRVQMSAKEVGRHYHISNFAIIWSGKFNFGKGKVREKSGNFEN